MFWGLVLKANKKYSQTVQKAFHLSQAALDLSKCGDADVQVMLTSEESTYLLCTLGKKNPQVALDLNFDEGDQISLSTKGEGVVHLTGYLLPNEDDLFDGVDEEEEEEDDEEVEASPQKGKGKGKERIAKKVAQKVNAKEVQLDDGEEDEMDETFELPAGAEKKSGAKGEEEEDDSDDDDSEEDDSDDDDSMDVSKLMDEEDSEDDDDDDDEDEDEDDDDESETEQPKAKVAKVEKKSSKQNGVENGKASPKEQKKEGQESESKIRTLQGGLVVEDMKVGAGQEAKPGKKIAVYYEGRLKKNNKVFDSTTKGAGFKFALGRGEVIKGWDLGVSGMKIGGKRRLTVPHQLAYGTRGSPPVIPPNSTLVFDVELKNVF